MSKRTIKGFYLGLVLTCIFGLLKIASVYGEELIKDVPVDVTVREAIALSVLPDDAHNVDGNMWIDMDVNSYTEATMMIQAATNCPDGLSVTMNDMDEDTDLRHSNGIDGIPSISEQPIAGESAWSVRGGILTDFTAMPKRSENGVKILQTNAPTADIYDEAELTFAFSSYSTQAPGEYKDYIVFTASVNATHVPESAETKFEQAFRLAGKTKINGYYAMQDMTPSICSAIETPAARNNGIINSAVESISLIDTRDNNVYRVRKYADGNCWMSQNLRLNLSTSITLTRNDTDINTDWTPENNTQTTAGIAWKNYNVAMSQRGSVKEYGNYYNWYAATAGTGTSSLSTADSDATGSICPRGWQLPRDDALTNRSFGAFIATYGINVLKRESASHNGDTLREPFSFGMAGYYAPNNGSIAEAGSGGYWWSSTVQSSNNAYVTDMDSTKIFWGDKYSKLYGMSVTCVAR